MSATSPRTAGLPAPPGLQDEALRRVEELLKAGYRYIVDADLKSYFDTIPHDRLRALVAEKVSDGRILALIEAFLKQGVLDGLREWTPTMGSPQGAVISPLLSNIYLNPLDHLMAREGFEMVRYADDFVILCRSPEEAAQAVETVQQGTAEAGLTLHPTKTRIVDATSEGFDFLGYRFEGGTRRPRTNSLDKLKDTIRAKTKRTSGESLRGIIDDVNRTLRRLVGAFQAQPWLDIHPRGPMDPDEAAKHPPETPGLPGRGRGSDHHRWPNAFFADQGLFSLRAGHSLPACQSLKR